MELWIRSQDRTKLVKVDSVTYMDMSEDMNTEVHSIWNVNGGILGTYKTKERALQVLDKIQNILQPRVVVHEPNINYDDMMHSLAEDMCLKTTQKVEMELKQVGQVVYQMPDE